MYRLIITFAFICSFKNLFAQANKDSLIYQLPVVNGKLVYTDSVSVNKFGKTALDSMAKKWFKGYFPRYQSKPVGQAADTNSSIFNRAILAYKIRPGWISIDFEAVVFIKITCGDNYYKYKIYEIYFRPANGALNKVGYQNDPEYLIKLYKQKHLGFMTSMNLSRGMIREYLFKTNAAILACIISLNKAMANNRM